MEPWWWLSHTAVIFSQVRMTLLFYCCMLILSQLLLGMTRRVPRYLTKVNNTCAVHNAN